MDLTHRFTVPAGLDEAWEAFNKLERIAPCFPGATVTSIDGDDFAGSVKVKLGPIALVYNGTGKFVERDETARRAVIEAKGKDKRGNGTANATITATFVGNGDGTDVQVVTDLAITGKPAQFGRGVISDVSDKLLDQFVNCVSGKFAEGFGPDPLTVTDGSEAEATGAMTAAETQDGPAAATTAAKDTDFASGSTTTRPTGPAYSYTPPKDAGPTDLNMAATIAPVLLKRFGPALAGLAALTWIVVKVVKRKK